MTDKIIIEFGINWHSFLCLACDWQAVKEWLIIEYNLKEQFDLDFCFDSNYILGSFHFKTW